MNKLSALALIPLLAACSPSSVPAGMQYECSAQKPAATGLAGAFAAGRARGEAAAAAKGATRCTSGEA